MRRTPLRSVENARRPIAAGTLYYSLDWNWSMRHHRPFRRRSLRNCRGAGRRLSLTQAEERLWDNASGDEPYAASRARVTKRCAQCAGNHRRWRAFPPAGAARRRRCWNGRQPGAQALAQKIDGFENLGPPSTDSRARLLQEDDGQAWPT